VPVLTDNGWAVNRLLAASRGVMPFVTVGRENSGLIRIYYEDHGSGAPVAELTAQRTAAPAAAAPAAAVAVAACPAGHNGGHQQWGERSGVLTCR
jgi:hypothetical protein